MIVKYNNNECDEIVFELKNGKSAIIPTDTQIGIISIVKNQIYKIKKRSPLKKIVLFVKDISYIPDASEEFKLLAKKYWPGKLTIIENSISYRIPNTKLLLNILDKIPRFYCSSANISGKDPVSSIEEAINVFAKDLDKIIFVEDKITNEEASTIYSLDENKVLREGKIKEGEIYEYLQKNNNR